MSENLYTFAVLILYGLVAQLNRASDSGSECRGFESHRGHAVNPRSSSNYGDLLSKGYTPLLTQKDQMFPQNFRTISTTLNIYIPCLHSQSKSRKAHESLTRYHSLYVPAIQRSEFPPVSKSPTPSSLPTAERSRASTRHAL